MPDGPDDLGVLPLAKVEEVGLGDRRTSEQKEMNTSFLQLTLLISESLKMRSYSVVK